MQETFVRAWRHLSRLLASGRPLRPWLRQVLRNVLTDAARVARNRPTSPLDQTPVEPEVDGGYETVLDRRLLTRALQRLSPDHRRVLLEIYYRDVPAPQFADFADFMQTNGFEKVGPWRAKATPEAIIRDAKALVAWLDGDWGKACAVLSCIYVVGMTVIWFAPETKGQPLPE